MRRGVACGEVAGATHGVRLAARSERSKRDEWLARMLAVLFALLACSHVRTFAIGG